MQFRQECALFPTMQCIEEMKGLLNWKIPNNKLWLVEI